MLIIYNLRGLREEDHRFRASLAYIVRPCIKQKTEETSEGVGLLLSVRSLPSLCEALELVPWGKMNANVGFGVVAIAVFMNHACVITLVLVYQYPECLLEVGVVTPFLCSLLTL